MSADDIFNAAIAIAREVVDERSDGARLRNVLESCGIRIRDVGACYDAASEFAAPYLARIAELEAESKQMHDACSDMLRDVRMALHVPDGASVIDAAHSHTNRITKLEAENKSLRDTCAEYETALSNAALVLGNGAAKSANVISDAIAILSAALRGAS